MLLMLLCSLQFLYLKNVRAFLQSCKKQFGIKDGDLFDPYDLIEAKDFNKVSTFIIYTTVQWLSDKFCSVQSSSLMKSAAKYCCDCEL